MTQIFESSPASLPQRAEGPVGVVLIGCGAVARLFYASTLQELERHGLARVLALVDPSPVSRAALARIFPHARELETPEAGVAVPGGELAIIASPPHVHRAHAAVAFCAGLDVLCEKPMAATASDCEAMIEAANAHGRILAVGQFRRFFPAHLALKHFIAQKSFGELQHLEIIEGGKFGWPAASDSFFRKEQTAGGVLLDIGVHVLDLVLWWLGEPVEFSYEDDALDGLEANALLRSSFHGGATATIRLSRDWSTLNTYSLRFERATVHLRVNQANQAEITFDGVPMTFAAELREPVDARYPKPTPVLDTNPQAFISQLVDVLGAVKERRAPQVPGTEAIRPIRWIEQCYKNRKPMPMPWMLELPEEENSCR